MENEPGEVKWARQRGSKFRSLVFSIQAGTVNYRLLNRGLLQWCSVILGRGAESPGFLLPLTYLLFFLSRSGVYSPSLYLWAGLVTCLTNRILWKWHSGVFKVGYKQPCSFLWVPLNTQSWNVPSWNPPTIREVEGTRRCHVSVIWLTAPPELLHSIRAERMTELRLLVM